MSEIGYKKGLKQLLLLFLTPKYHYLLIDHFTVVLNLPWKKFAEKTGFRIHCIPRIVNMFSHSEICTNITCTHNEFRIVFKRGFTGSADRWGGIFNGVCAGVVFSKHVCVLEVVFSKVRVLEVVFSKMYFLEVYNQV